MPSSNEYQKKFMAKKRKLLKAQGIVRREYYANEKRHSLHRKINKLNEQQADAIEAKVDGLGVGDE